MKWPRRAKQPSQEEKEIFVVSGPSSAGKSTYISKCNDVEPPCERIIYAHEIATNSEIPECSLVHYNTLRVIDRNRPEASAGSISRYGKNLTRPDFSDDPAWQRLKAERNRLRVVVILAREFDIWTRCLTRQYIEPQINRQPNYPINRWMGHYKKLDLEEHYRAWLSELNSAGISFEVIEQAEGGFKKVCDVERFLQTINIKGGKEIQLIEEMLADSSNKSTYQKIALKQGSISAGQDRSKTLNVILNHISEDDAVLDVGCAQGLFCFEAERRGASTINGVDIKPDRFEAARLLGRILKSEVKFYLRDVSEEPITQLYDVVLALNLIHHLEFPFNVLHDLARITRRVLIIEFPGMTDPKYCDTIHEGLDRGDQLPLIGVSLLAEKDQTFVFSPEGLRRILVRSVYGFSSVDIVDSPMTHRYIAICKK